MRLGGCINLTKASDDVDAFIKKNPWIMSRLWDDDCECEKEEVVLDTCPRHGDNKEEYFKKKRERIEHKT